MAGLTRENVASHLQKHRMRLKKEEDEAGGHHAPAASGPADHKRAAAAAEADALRKQRPRRAAAAGAAAAAAAAAAIVPELSQVSGKAAGRLGLVWGLQVGRFGCMGPDKVRLAACGEAEPSELHHHSTPDLACTPLPHLADGRTAEGGA